uniref:C2 domain-containing protein n=1 Tax=Mesocestoides corti TaxID=53468 RepID=A0A5K3FMB3_MESCO
MSAVNHVPIIVHRDVCGISVERCLPEHRILKVLVIRGASLMKKDIFGTSDPYCRISLYRDVRQSNCIGSYVRTRTIKRTLNPLWNEEFYFRVNPDSNRLVFELFDENRITRDDFLGLVSIYLPQLDIRVEGQEDSSRNAAKNFLLRPRSAGGMACNSEQ